MTSAQGKAPQVREQIKQSLLVAEKVTVDFSNMRSLSPSFAYEAFGLLVDEFGENLQERIEFVNDNLNLSSRVLDALNRRLNVIRPRAS